MFAEGLPLKFLRSDGNPLTEDLCMYCLTDVKMVPGKELSSSSFNVNCRVVPGWVDGRA